MVLPDMYNLDDGENSCEFEQDAEMLLFDLDSEVQTFIELLKQGDTILRKYFEI